MSNYIIHSQEALVFRDGRPFGDPGNVDAGLLQWPLPPTITGMMRTQVGLSRDATFFNNSTQNNLSEIIKVKTERILPMWQKEETADWQLLYPAPADALLVAAAAADNFQVHSFTYETVSEDEGVDLPWPEWRLPFTTAREKPARNCPALWHEDQFLQWLENGEIKGTIPFRKLGLPWPQTAFRMHTAISDSGTATASQLFSTQGIRLETLEKSEQGRRGRYGIGVTLSGTKNGDDPTGPCRLGGERKVARIDALEKDPFPEFPKAWFTEERFLRLILLSPGNFGGWAPEWLRPDVNSSTLSWKKVPGTGIELRLVSAHIPRWQPVSGWDFAQGAPRATSKLVPAGSVYIVELQNPKQSLELAEKFWGRSIADDLDEANGYGIVCTGKLTIQGEK
ncbi:MAG: hypothetical protein CSA20_08735 [Deltaproteobacteria bacterium]|nr:MAG: hypothetical protein CSA20_08735 [Deltaproteobacteria bacterium]